LDSYFLFNYQHPAQAGDTIMPIYEYICPHCHNTFEEWLKSDDSNAEHPCPQCGKSAHRQISQTSFILKGGGWYVTEYGSHKEEGKSEATTGATTGVEPASAAPTPGEDKASAAPTAPAATPSAPAPTPTVAKESAPASPSAAS
jgi:putative FmdB family regulatory protein